MFIGEKTAKTTTENSLINFVSQHTIYHYFCWDFLFVRGRQRKKRLWIIIIFSFTSLRLAEANNEKYLNKSIDRKIVEWDGLICLETSCMPHKHVDTYFCVWRGNQQSEWANIWLVVRRNLQRYRAELQNVGSLILTLPSFLLQPMSVLITELVENSVCCGWILNLHISTVTSVESRILEGLSYKAQDWLPRMNQLTSNPLHHKPSFKSNNLLIFINFICEGF